MIAANAGGAWSPIGDVTTTMLWIGGQITTANIMKGVFPTDPFLWEFMAYCAGTGGSILIIGSAAGVAAMGLEKIEFSLKLPYVVGYNHPV